MPCYITGCVDRKRCFNPIVVATAFYNNDSIVVTFTNPPPSLSYEKYVVCLKQGRWAKKERTVDLSVSPLLTIHSRLMFTAAVAAEACAYAVKTRSPATAGKANRSLLFLEHRIPMPELFTDLRFSVLREFWTQAIRLPLLGGDAPRLG